MNIDSARYAKNPTGILNDMKFEVTHRAKSLGWYKELIQELLEEDYGPDSEKLRGSGPGPAESQ